MPDFSQRNHQQELMDDLNIPADELHNTLRELDTINHWLNGYITSIQGILSLIPTNTNQVRLFDLGTGGGELLPRVYRQLQSKQIDTTLKGIDFNPNCVEYAQKHNPNSSIQYHTQNVWDAINGETYDIIHASLFFHHFQNHEMIELLKRLKQCTRWGVVINDLHRHPLAYYSILWLTKWFSKNRLIQNDAPISVLRAFSRSDLDTLVHQAGWKQYRITWRWAFRWLVVLHQDNNHHE